MSTQIITFDKTVSGREYEILNIPALRVFAYSTLPLMFLSFAAWLGVYWYENRKEKARSMRRNLLGSP